MWYGFIHQASGDRIGRHSSKGAEHVRNMSHDFGPSRGTLSGTIFERHLMERDMSKTKIAF